MKLKLSKMMNDALPPELPVEPLSSEQADRIKELTMKKIHEPKHTRHIRPLRRGIAAVVLAAALCGTAAAIVQYSGTTQQMEDTWSFVEEINNRWNQTEGMVLSSLQTEYIEGRTVAIQQSVTNAGVTITLDSMTCMNHEVYIAMQTELTPDCDLDYDPEEILIWPENFNFYWTNPSYGRIQGQRGGSIGADSMDLWSWDSVPNNANLCDGETVLEIEISSFSVLSKANAQEELAQIDGTWNFTLEIPAMPEPEFTVDSTPLEEAFGMTDATFQITSTGYRLNMPEEFYPTMHDLLDDADEDETALVIDVYLKDGTKMPFFGAGGEVKDGRVEYIVDWVPIDPTTLDYMVVTDGVTEVTLPIT